MFVDWMVFNVDPRRSAVAFRRHFPESPLCPSGIESAFRARSSLRQTFEMTTPPSPSRENTRHGGRKRALIHGGPAPFAMRQPVHCASPSPPPIRFALRCSMRTSSRIGAGPRSMIGAPRESKRMPPSRRNGQPRRSKSEPALRAPEPPLPEKTAGAEREKRRHALNGRGSQESTGRPRCVEPEPPGRPAAAAAMPGRASR
jgi:hypothetical protein